MLNININTTYCSSMGRLRLGLRTYYVRVMAGNQAANDTPTAAVW